jgi:hypothetical protein
MLCGSALSKPPLFTTLFANRPIDELFEALFNPISNK